MKNNAVKKVVATGIGAALFFVLARFVAIPTGIPNTNIAFQYAIQAVFAVLFGPIVGCLSGFIGHVLCDMSWGGVWWTWAIATGLFGLIIGLMAKKIKASEGSFGKKEILLFILADLVACIIAWGIVAPVGDVVIYHEDAKLVFVQGLVAGAGDFVFSVIIGGLLLFAYAKTIAKPGSLDKE